MNEIVHIMCEVNEIMRKHVDSNAWIYDGGWSKQMDCCVICIREDQIMIWASKAEMDKYDGCSNTFSLFDSSCFSKLRDYAEQSCKSNH